MLRDHFLKILRHEGKFEGIFRVRYVTSNKLSRGEICVTNVLTPLPVVQVWVVKMTSRWCLLVGQVCMSPPAIFNKYSPLTESHISLALGAF